MDEVKLSAIAQKLWDADENRMVHGKNFEIDLQKPVIRYENLFKDRCENPLFKSLNEDYVFKIATYQKFTTLLDNYVTNVGHSEVVTQEELNEQNAFLDACLGTPVMKEAFNFLVNEKVIRNNLRDFKNLLTSIWFQMYNRNAKVRLNDSCAFEHVFIGEKNEEGVIGCHNWLQYYLLEKQKMVDYYGYIPNQCQYSNSKNKSCPDMIAVQFFKDESVKAVGGFLLGVSPEFEIALYTIIFLCGGEVTKLNFANMSITFRCYKMQRYGKTVLATVYPSKN